MLVFVLLRLGELWMDGCVAYGIKRGPMRGRHVAGLFCEELCAMGVSEDEKKRVFLFFFTLVE